MSDKLKRFLRLFDSTFFKMSFQFFIILFLAFIVLIVISAYEAKG